jgi:TatD DNase family protein
MVKKIPLERLIVETDAPYLAPHPFRGKINKPSYITYTAQKIAEIKDVSYDKIVEITNRNTKELFKI